MSIPRKRGRRLLLFFSTIVLVVWGLLYLPHLRTSPRWYGDETITLACGHDLVQGIFANRGTWNTYVNPQFVYQPGYVALVGAASYLTNRDILAPRFINTLCALAVGLIAIWVLGRRFGALFGLVMALTFLAYLQSVIHFRWIYAHNAVAAGFFLCFSLLSVRQTTRRYWAAGLGLAIAAASHPLSIYGGLAGLLNQWRQPKSWIPLFLPPVAAGLLVLLPIYLRYSGWMAEDVHHLGEFYKLSSQENSAHWGAGRNFTAFFAHDFFHLAAGISLIFLFFTRLRPIAIMAVLSAILLTTNRQNLPVFYYQAVIILPLLAASLAYGIWRLCTALRRFNQKLRWLPFALPLMLLCQSLPPALSGTLISRNDTWVTQSLPDLASAVKWINTHTNPDNLVVAHWNTGWLLNTHTADLLQCTAYAGWPTHTFEQQPSKDRFRFDLSPGKVRYLVLGDIDMRWTIHNPNVNKWIEFARLEKWPIVFQTPTYLILENPNWKP